MKKVFDEIEVRDLVVDVYPEFGKVFLWNQDDTGMVIAKFKIGSANFEYREWYSVHSGKVGKVDTIRPGATSDLAVMLDDYVKTAQDEHGIGWDFFSELNDYIERIISIQKVRDASDRLWFASCEDSPEKEQEQEQEQDQHGFISPAELISLAKSIDVISKYQNTAQAQEALDAGVEALSEKLALVINGAKIKHVDHCYRIIISLPLRDDEELFAVRHSKEGFTLCAMDFGSELDEIAEEIYSGLISSYFEYLSR